MYCFRCQTFLTGASEKAADRSVGSDKVLWAPYARTEYLTIEDVEHGSSDSCALCRIVRHTWADWEWLKFSKSDKVSLEIVVDNGMPIVKASVIRNDDQSRPDTRMIGMYLRETASADLNDVLAACSTQENSNTGSSSSFTLARYWLDDCLKQHAKCPKPQAFLPTRVIDVGPAGALQDPRVVESADLNLSAALIDQAHQFNYVALSHCWGPPPWFRTTRTSLADRLKGIKMDELPTTFRDAVTATRRIGLRYLWIDSLCIIQEDSEDWKKEAVRMCDYYSNALFTITSARSDNSHGGLFATRDGLRVLPFVIDVRLDDRSVHCQFTPMPKREIVWDMQDLTLYKRAWVLQEMILSRRALIFDPDAVRWECLTSHGSERDPAGGIVRHHNVIREVQNAIAYLDTEQDVWDVLGEDVQMRSARWQHVVEDFMGRSLTQESDRLIAMAGVAEALQRHTKDTYIAGLWRTLLPHGLTWHVRHPVDPDVINANGTNVGIVVQPPPYRNTKSVAPSWSFASVNVPVSYSTSVQERPLCRVLSATVEGPPHCQSGVLTIEGDTRTLYVLREHESILKEVLKLSKDKHYRYPEDHGLTQILLRPDSLLLVSNEPPTKWRRHAQAITGHWYPDEVIDPATPITFLALTQRPRLEAMPSGTRAQVVHTLALAKTGNDGEYRRIGYAAWEDCAWYGYDCCEYDKGDPYRRLEKSWGRVKPPELSKDRTAQHPSEKHSVAHGPFPDSKAYHSRATAVRQTVGIE